MNSRASNPVSNNRARWHVYFRTSPPPFVLFVCRVWIFLFWFLCVCRRWMDGWTSEKGKGEGEWQNSDSPPTFVSVSCRLFFGLWGACARMDGMTCSSSRMHGRYCDHGGGGLHQPCDVLRSEIHTRDSFSRVHRSIVAHVCCVSNCHVCRIGGSASEFNN